jgi:hypothetical protein
VRERRFKKIEIIILKKGGEGCEPSSGRHRDEFRQRLKIEGRTPLELLPFFFSPLLSLLMVGGRIPFLNSAVDLRVSLDVFVKCSTMQANALFISASFNKQQLLPYTEDSL